VIRNCATVEEFKAALKSLPRLVLLAADPLPGDSVTHGGETIRYMPPPPRDGFIDGVKAAINHCEFVMDEARVAVEKADHYRQNERGWAQRGRFDGAREVHQRLCAVVGRPSVVQVPNQLPPKDDPREAFEAWAPDHGLDVSPSTRAPFQSTGPGGVFYRYESTDIAYAAFLAGRASVKP